ncbi:MAG: hypothetical protein V1773_04715 [bacterium]
MRFIYLIMFLFAFDLFAQIDANTPKALKEFIQMRDSLVENFAGEKGFTKTFSENEIYNIAKVYYNVLAKNSSEYRMYLLNERKTNADLIKNDKATIKDLTQYKGSLIAILITKQYGMTFFQTERTPYFLRVRVEKKRNWVYKSSDAGDFDAVTMTCTIEDIIRVSSDSQ